MDKLAELKKRMRAVVGEAPRVTFDGRVTKITGDTCSVMIGDVEVDDVRLKSSASGEETIFSVPAIGSHVLMISTDGTIDNLTVLKSDKVQRHIYSENGLSIDIDSNTGKIELKNKEISLHDLFQQLTELIRGLKVSTPVGPSGTPLPDTIVKLDQFEKGFKSLLK